MISTWCKIHSFCLLPSLPPENQPNTQRFIRQTLVRTKALKSNIRTSAAKNIQDGSIQTAAECDMPDNKPPAIVLPVRHKVVCTILSDSAARLLFASIQTNILNIKYINTRLGPECISFPFNQCAFIMHLKMKTLKVEENHMNFVLGGRMKTECHSVHICILIKGICKL